MSEHQLRWMAAFSIIYISAALAFYGIGFGDVSLVYGNIINLSARILYCTVFVSSYFTSEDGLMMWNNVRPRWHVLLATAMSGIFIWYSDRTLGATEVVQRHGRSAVLCLPVMIHVALGGVLLLACIATWWMASGRLLTLPRRIKID
jgi:oligosaccharide translocation protein RFT1